MTCQIYSIKREHLRNWCGASILSQEIIATLREHFPVTIVHTVRVVPGYWVARRRVLAAPGLLCGTQTLGGVEIPRHPNNHRASRYLAAFSMASSRSIKSMGLVTQSSTPAR